MDPGAGLKLPARGRPRLFDLDEALGHAVRVFSERGYHGTSISELGSAMGLTAGSLYKAFADTRAVFIAALEHYGRDRSAALDEALAAAGNGRDAVRAALDFYAGASHGRRGREGCLVVGTATELAALDPEISTRVVAALRRREALLAELLQRGQADGSLPATLDVKATARFLLCLLQGLRVVGKTSPTRADTEAVVDVAMAALK
jgi:AcrR family transcriptional regulator